MIDSRTVRDTELDKVLDMIRRSALSPEGRDAITPSLITSESAVIEKRAARIEAYMNLLSGTAPDPFPPVSDIFSYVSSTHADIPGEAVWRAGCFLRSYVAMLVFLEKEEDVHSEDRELSEEILSSIDQDGNVFEDHPRLLPLLRKRDEIRAERERFSQRFISEHRAVVQQSEALYRNGRVVIAIRSDQKRIPGCCISGASASGNTLFAEPQELLAYNNEAVIAEERIRAEKARILHDLSDRVRHLAPVLRDMLDAVIDFDLHYSFALWARRSKAVHPQMGGTLSLIAARHPLLGDAAVPITVKLPDDVRVLVLSGANAGGKTVTMKTIALLALLNQIAGYIPADSHSVMPVFSCDLHHPVNTGVSCHFDIPAAEFQKRRLCFPVLHHHALVDSLQHSAVRPSIPFQIRRILRCQKRHDIGIDMITLEPAKIIEPELPFCEDSLGRTYYPYESSGIEPCVERETEHPVGCFPVFSVGVACRRENGQQDQQLSAKPHLWSAGPAAPPRVDLHRRKRLYRRCGFAGAARR